VVNVPIPQRNDTLPFRQESVEVVVPVYNEQEALPKSIPALCAYLENYFPYRWSVVIADNASTDATLAVANGLAFAGPHVSVLHLEEKGRGRALKAAWLASKADIVAYMDVDLSTNLWSFLPLIAPLASGHSDLAIGSRLLKGAMVTRQWKREVISRCYNLLIKAMFGNGFSDAQCGFKAVKRSVAQELLPSIEDGEWFFDTELLLLAEERGYRISEVPVDWVEDLDSRVDVTSTALKDVKGLLRVRAERLRRRWISDRRSRDVARHGRALVAVFGGDGEGEPTNGSRGERRVVATMRLARRRLPYSDDS
jgi:glycosyltransferase involved in cell wall biosynthesis